MPRDLGSGAFGVLRQRFDKVLQERKKVEKQVKFLLTLVMDSVILTKRAKAHYAMMQEIAGNSR